MRSLAFVGASLMLVSTMAGCSQPGPSRLPVAAGPLPSHSQTSTADPIVRAALDVAHASSGRIVGYGLVYSHWSSPKMYYRARFVVMQDGRLFLFNGAAPDTGPIALPPGRLQPESASESVARERTLAMVEARVARVNKNLTGVVPGVTSYAVQVKLPKGGSATYLVSPDGRVVARFTVSTSYEAHRFGGYQPWSVP